MPQTLKYLAGAALVITVLAWYPQINLWLLRGANWQGAYVTTNYDEVAYSTYLNALIEGRPRRNNPFTGQDNVAYESLFSVQFIPAYAVAGPARALGLSAATAFVWLMPLMALGAVLALFWLIKKQTGDDALAAVGAVTVLCAGTLLAGQGVLSSLWGGGELQANFFPYLRRYQPGVAFPLFFVFTGLTWQALRADTRGRVMGWASGAGAVFGVLVFSYFYLWTAAAAWFMCLIMLWFSWRPAERGRVFLVCGMVGAWAAVALLPYFRLLGQRAPEMDGVQILTMTRAPHLTAWPELLGFAVVALLAWAARKGKLAWREPQVLFCAALALMPFVVFNQQIITGRSLQPVHYQLFIANYAALLALVLAAHLWRGAELLPRRALLYVALAMAGLGLAEAGFASTKALANARVWDEAQPVARRLQQLAASETERYPVVFTPNFGLAEYFPAHAPVRALWGVHTTAAGGVSQPLNRELLFWHLYYSGLGPDELRHTLAASQGFEILAALFGPERALNSLGHGARPVTAAEAQAEIQNYQEFIARITPAQAHRNNLRYAVALTQAQPDWKNLDRWYERDAGENVGLFTLYRLKPRG